MSEQPFFIPEKPVPDEEKSQELPPPASELPPDTTGELKKNKRRFLPTWRSIKHLGLFLLVLLLIGYIGLHIGVRMWFNRQLVRADPPWISSEAYQLALEYWNQTIHFPKEWSKKFPTSNVIVGDLNYLKNKWEHLNQTDDLVSELNRWRDNLQQRNSLVSKTDFASLQGFMVKVDPFLKETRPMISVLNHELQRIAPSEFLPRFYENAYFINILQDLIRLKSLVLNSEKKYAESVDLTLFALPLYCLEPLPNYNEYLWRIYLLAELIEEIQANCNAVWEKTSLESWLKTLNRWTPYLFRLKEEYINNYNLFVELTKANIPIQYGAETNARIYIRQMKDSKYPPRGFYKSYKRYVDELLMYALEGQWPEKKETQSAGIEMIRPLILTSDIENYYMLNSFGPDVQWSWEREQTVANQYDRLRLSIAAKLYFLEKKRFPVAAADLVPAYFSSEIRERKTGKAYSWDAKGNLVVPSD